MNAKLTALIIAYAAALAVVLADLLHFRPG